jgi:HEAT repeat protein
MNPTPSALRRLPVTIIATLILLALSATSALAQGGSVRYSYEKIYVAGSEQYALVPRAEIKDINANGKVSKGDAIKAFDLLKSRKGNVYGSASVKILPGKWPDKARIQVNIDRKYAAYAEVVMAEVVYTFAEMGLDGGVEFPGYADGAVKRSDIRFPVYTLTLPMWQALPPVEASPAQVTLSNGETLWAGDFYQRWKKKDDALVKDLYGFLESSNALTVVSVMRKLPSLKIPYTAQVIPLLAHSNQLVRAEAIRALEAERDEVAVLEAVAVRLDDKKESVPALQKQAAEFLGKSKNKKYAILEPIWTIQNAEKEDEAKKAIGDLIKFKGDDRVSSTLAKEVAGKRQAVAEAAIDALGKINDDATRLKLLEDEKVDTARLILVAKDLSQEKAAAPRVAGLSFIAANSTAQREAERAIEELAKGKDEASRKAAEAFLMDKIDWRRQAAAAGLAARDAVESLPAFATAIKKYKNDRELEDAGYTIMLSQSLKTILEQTKAKDNITQRLAYRALGERAVKEKAGSKVMDTLKAGASNKDPLIRGASARALGEFANKDAADILSGMVKDRDEDVRRDVAIAIGKLEDGALVDALIGYLDDKSPEVIAAAIDSLGVRKEAAAWDRIKGYADSKDPVIRASALRGLARLTSRDDKQTVTEVISILSGAVNDKNLDVRKRAIEQLGTFKDENAVLAIAAQLQAKETDVRIAAIRALGTTKHPSATPLVTDALEDPNAEIRRAATLAVADLEDKSARKDLQAQMDKEQDDELKSMMRDTLKKL